MLIPLLLLAVSVSAIIVLNVEDRRYRSTITETERNELDEHIQREKIPGDSSHSGPEISLPFTIGRCPRAQ